MNLCEELQGPPMLKKISFLPTETRIICLAILSFGYLHHVCSYIHYIGSGRPTQTLSSSPLHEAPDPLTNTRSSPPFTTPPAVTPHPASCISLSSML